MSTSRTRFSIRWRPLTYWCWQAKRALIALRCGAASLCLGVLIGLLTR